MGVWVLGVCWEVLQRWKGDAEGTPTWDHTYQLKLCVPPICCVVNLWGVSPCVGMDGKVMLFELE